MEYNRITYFLKAAETLNFTKAADELFISRQALAKQISLLEEDLGVVLFERNTRKIVLTNAGQEAYKRFMRATAEMEKAVEAVRGLGQNRRPMLRIGFFNDIQRSIINNIMRCIREEFPDIILDLRVVELFELRNSLIQGKVDLCLAYLEPGEQWEKCEKLVLRYYPPQVYVFEDHPWASKKEITVEDMLQEEFVMLKDERMDLEGFFENIPCRSQVWMPNIDSIILWLEQGRGFTVGNKFSNSYCDKMIAFPAPDCDVLLEMACLWNKDNKNGYVEQVTELLTDMFVQDRIKG